MGTGQDFGMGTGSYYDVDNDKVIDLDSQGRVIEDGGVRKRVYRTSRGLQVGCTFITDAAIKKLVAIWKEEDEE